MILERHGVENAKKCSGASGTTQEVTVIDAEGEVRLSIGGAGYPAGLTPDQARMIARQLNASAARVAKRASRPAPEGRPDAG